MKGVILRGVGGVYHVLDAEGRTHALKAQAKLRHLHMTPMVGDEVLFAPGEGEKYGWLTEILPRRNQLARPPVSNVDMFLAVTAAASPEPDLGLIDRLLLCAQLNRVPASLVVNKRDLSPGAAAEIARQYRGAGVPIFLTGAHADEGIEPLREFLNGKVCALGGPSGVGKSTLINALFGFERTTGGLSMRIERGKHTTRHCELIPVEGGAAVLDTPGFSLLELPLLNPMELSALMPEFSPYAGKCRFSGCMHISEPDCPALNALHAGGIDRERWARYAALAEEMRIRWRERYG